MVSLSYCFRNWSTFGLITQRQNSTSVQCISSHLTSFAVLLDHQGIHENEVCICYILLTNIGFYSF